MIRTLRWPLLALAALLLVALVQWTLRRTATALAPAFALESPAFGPSSYAELLAASDQQLALAQARVQRAPGEWLPHAGAASAALALFRLTGRIAYLNLAETEIAAVRALAPEPSGMPELRAELALVRHDLATAAQELDVFARASVPPDRGSLAEATAMRGDLALYSGDHRRAAQLYRTAAASDPHIGVAVRIANLKRIEGDFDGALATLVEATRRERHPPSVLWSIALQTGMIAAARGDYPAARGWYDRAEALLPGHWLTALYRAEARLALGESEPAIAELEAAARDHARPEAMDMLALVWRARGDSARSGVWALRARTIWRAWSKAHPAAFAAHAAEHELVFGDPREALRLAQANAAARPYGEAQLLLARALMANDQPRAALAEIALAEQSGWRSAPLFAIKAQALAIVGEAAAADAAREEARALNPRIEDPATRLIWLAHG